MIKFVGFLRRIIIKAVFSLVQFLVLFVVLMFGFTMSFTELYWINRQKDGAVHFCEVKNNLTKELWPTQDGTFENRCYKPIFTALISTFFDLFWALFGQFGIDCLRTNGTYNIINFISKTVQALISWVCTTFPLLLFFFNLLIALMSESLSKTS